MAYEAQKTEHAGPKKGAGAYWGRKKTAKKESNRVRRETDKKGIEMPAEDDPEAALDEGLPDANEKP